MLSDEHAALLAKYYNTVQLTGAQKDRLIEKYWEATTLERSEIARAYSSLFAQDGNFVQRLTAYRDTHHTASGATALNGNGNGNGRVGKSNGRDDRSPRSPTEADAGDAAVAAAARPQRSHLSHAQLLLRTAIQDHYPKLTGEGPFPVSFGLVASEEERREAIDLYAAQFEYPDPQELQKLVRLPQSSSTRTRKRPKGSYTWFIRSHTTREMVCAVTITAHQYEAHKFVEMPLFATGVGYKKNGFGRLLNAALGQWCAEVGFEFMMISADVQAIPFWTHLGFTSMSKPELTRIAFYYEHNCYKFKGAEAMIGYCKEWKRDSTSNCAVSAALEKMPKVVIVGTSSLPNP